MKRTTILVHSRNPFLLLYIVSISVITQFNHQISCSIDPGKGNDHTIHNKSASVELEERFHDHHRKPAHREHYPSASSGRGQQTGLSNTVIKKNKHRSDEAEKRQMRNRCLLAERELDRCSAQLIGLGQSSSMTYPDSMQDLDSVYCPKFRETIGCIKNNTDCYKPFERQIINWVLTSTRKMNHKRCKNENEKIRFLRLTNSCLSSMRNPMDGCMSHYIGSLDAIADYNRDLERLSEDDYQIQLSCCANRRFKQCVMNSAKQKCQSHEGLRKLRRTSSNSSQRVARKQLIRVVQDTMDDLKTTLEEMALTGPEFICKSIDEKFCKSRFDGRYTNRLARHESIVPAMLKIYANK